MRRLLLATDLDGTFLGGSADERAALYGWLARVRDHVGLMFVTGRDLTFVRGLVSSGEVPAPEHVIANVGTTAVSGPAFSPMSAVEHWIEAAWPSEAPSRISALLHDHHHLTPQPGVEGRRMSYFYTNEARAARSKEVIDAAGFDALTSAGIYFDVLPRGVHKGSTLRQVLGELQVDPGDVLVAGDTMNDLSLFQTGLAGVAVGNSEPKLLQAISGFRNVELARGHGAAGILGVLQPLLESRMP